MTSTPSSQAVKVLAAAVKRAARQDFGFVGTENLLIALAGTNGPGRVLGRHSTRTHAVARWAGEDGWVPRESDADVTALLRAAHHHARLKTALPESRALRECLRQAIEDAGDDVLTTTHLSVALLRQESGRVADVLAQRQVDVEEAIEAVRKAERGESRAET